jgi:secondary thiamine-phosphate synthase enzyme
MKQFAISTESRTQFVDITSEVQTAVRKLRIKDGVVTVFIPHTTAGVTINENADPDVTADMTAALDKAVPWRANYKHGEGNSAAHVKSSMMGPSLQVIVDEGKLVLGTWQAIYFCEFDGPRTRRVWVR